MHQFAMQPFNPQQQRPMEAAAGLGEYQPAPPMEAAAGMGMPVQMPVQMPGPITFEAAAGLGFPDPSGIGAYVTYPVRGRSTALQVAAAISPLAGALGQVADAVQEKQAADAAGKAGAGLAAGVVIAAVGLGLLVRGGAGYIVGKALAPSEKEETAYAWGGVLASVFLGSLGLGIEALIAGSRE